MSRLGIGVFVVLACWLVEPARGDERPISGATYTVAHWKPRDGLPQGSVKALAQTPDGYLWIGTESGLARFDGLSFSIFDAPSASVLTNHLIVDLAVTNDGTLWIGTNGGGLASYAGGETTLFDSRQGLPANRIMKLLAAKDGGLWISAYGGGVARWTGQAFEPLELPAGSWSGIATSLAETADGSLWVGTYSGLFRVRGTEVVLLDEDDGLLSAEIWSLATDRAGRLWIGTGAGVNVFEGSSGFDGLTAWTPKEGLSGKRVISLEEDAEGQMWVGSFGGGLDLFREGHPHSIRSQQGRLRGSAWTLRATRDGSIWVGTIGDGLYQYSRGPLRGYGPEEGLLGDFTTSVYADETATVWVGTLGGGLYQRQSERFEPALSGEGWMKDIWTVTGDGAGTLWLGTDQGGAVAWRPADGDLRRFTSADGLRQNVVFAMAWDPRGFAWVGTNGGLNRIDPRERDSAQAVRGWGRAEGLPGDQIRSLALGPDGMLWVGTVQGLARFDGTTFETIEPAFTNIWSVVADAEGAVWAGSFGGGLGLYQDGRLTALSARQGLTDDNVSSLVDDGRGHLWISSTRGIFRVRQSVAREAVTSERVLDPFVVGMIQALDVSTECHAVSLCQGARAPDGRLWFPTVEGVVAINPETGHLEPPRTIIEDVRIDGRPRSVGEVLSVPVGRLTIQVSAPTFQGADQLELRYRLEGLESAWSQPRRGRLAEYQDLPKGAYTFRAMARHPDGKWGYEAVLDLTVEAGRRPSTWAMVALSVLLTGALAGLGHRLHVRSLRARERELEDSVRERTRDLARAQRAAQAANRAKTDFLASMSHELRTPMNGVIGMTSLLRETALHRDQKDFVETIRASGENMIKLINQVLDYSKVESGHIELEPAATDLRQIVEECFDIVAKAAADRGLSLAYVVTTGQPPGMIVDALRLRQILLNLVGNAVKFTAQGEIVVELEVQHAAGRAEARFRVQDTGPGIAPEFAGKLFTAFRQGDTAMNRAHSGTGLGLAISRRLSELLDGHIGFENRAGGGSTFFFTVKGEPSPEAGVESGKDLEPLTGKSILVIAASDGHRRMLIGLARSWGLRASAVSSPKLASQWPETVDAALWAPELTVDLDGLVDSSSELARLNGGFDPLSGKDVSSGKDLPIVLLAAPALLRSLQAGSVPGVSDMVALPLRHLNLLRCLSQAFQGVRDSAPSSALASPERPDFGHLRVLLVEDNAVNQQVAVMMLKRLGARVDVAANGQEALDALRTMYYDLVLMDLQMPVLDGFGATLRIRRELPPEQQPRIVALTASITEKDRRHCLDVGMEDVLGKPIRLENLAATLAEV